MASRRSSRRQGSPPADIPEAGLAGMIDALTGAFQNISASRGLPTLKLTKFRGFPEKSGDPTVIEWLEEYEDYCHYYKLNPQEKTQVLLTHLADCAKDEVRCHDPETRGDSSALKAILISRFGKKESVQPLTSQLHARVQKPGESLAEFSSSLLRLYDRMESAASIDEKEALAKMKDSTLKERFITGVKDRHFQRELRRTALSNPRMSFLDFRKEVLDLFQDEDFTPPRANIREVEIEAQRVSSHPIEDPAVQSMRSEISELRDALKEVVQAVKTIESGPARRRPDTEFCYNCHRRGHFKRECPSPPMCYGCKQFGHIRRDCPLENNHQAPTQSQGDAPNMEEPQPQGRVRAVQRQGETNLAPQLVSQSPRAEVQIAGVSTMCVLDTGAEASLIPSSFYNEHLKGHVPLDGDGAGVRVVGVTGSILPIIGYIRAPVIVDRKSTQVGFLIVEDATREVERKKESSVILGCNALRMLLQGGLQGSEGWNLVEKTLELQQSTPAASALLVMSDDEIIPPLTVRRIECRLEDSEALHGMDVLVEPLASPKGYLDENYLDVYDGCMHVSGPKLEVTVANRSSELKTINQGTVVASVVEVADREEIYVVERDGVIEVNIADVTAEIGAGAFVTNNKVAIKFTESAAFCRVGRVTGNNNKFLLGLTQCHAKVA